MEQVFNKKSRVNNSLKASAFGLTGQLVALITSFIFRTVFIRILSVEYLGLNGLFTNVLTVLSLAELGVGSAITYRMYKPINDNDAGLVAAFMSFYKKIYLVIAVIVTVLGLAVMPFLPYLINDTAEIPADINIYVIYALFLSQTISSYLFAYKSGLLTADQKNHIVSLINMATSIITNGAMILFLLLTKNYVVVLLVSIVIKISMNILLSFYVTKKYKAVFNIKASLDKEQKQLLKKDIFGIMCHKLGGVVVNGTDSILISAFIGLGVLGIYSNYSLIIVAVAGILAQIFASFIGSIGNAHINLENDVFFERYHQLNFANFFAAAFASICIFVLINPFVTVWLGEGMLLEQTVVLVVALNFFFTQSKHINHSHTTATGLFKKDKWRPIAEAGINLIASVILVKYLGVVGIFLGTLISNLSLSLWRETVLIHKHIFKKTTKKYFFKLLYFFAITAGIGAGFYFLLGLLPNTVPFVLLKFLITISGTVVLLCLFTFFTSEFKYFKNLFLGKFKNLIGKIRKTKIVKDDDQMKIIQTELDGVFLVEPKVFGDERGWFTETFREDKMKEAGIDAEFVQENQSFSAKKGTLRGIHYQNYPYAQSKLVRCLKGEILDVAVDLREWSPNYKKWVSAVLSADNKKQLFIPRGFGHAFLTLTDDAEVAYKVDEYYNKESEGGINYTDGDIGVKWEGGDFVLSEKDKTAPPLSGCVCNFGARVLVTGVAGQLGCDVARLLKKKGIEHIGVDMRDFDITDGEAVSAYIGRYKPTVIVHCAAYTAVDKAEDDKDKCYAVNVAGTKNLAAAAKAAGAAMLYVSTDYVYGGEGNIPFTESDKPNPKNVYGLTKKQGEDEVLSALEKYFILRTSWVFGRYGNNFVKTMLRLAGEKRELTVVDDQIGSPTYTADLARLIVEMIFTDKYGIYNASNSGVCSWYEFAREIFAKAGVSVAVKPVKSGEYAAKAVRPLNSRLDKSKLAANGFNELPDWKNALERYLKEGV